MVQVAPDRQTHTNIEGGSDGSPSSNRQSGNRGPRLAPLLIAAAVVLHSIIVARSPCPEASVGQQQQLVSSKKRKSDSAVAVTTSLDELDHLTDHLLGPDSFGTGDCPSACGCWDTPHDCPRHYILEDVNASATAVLTTATSLEVARKLETQHVQAIQICNQPEKSKSKRNSVLGTGGWCLGHRREYNPVGGTMTLHDGRNVTIPHGHIFPSKRVGDTLANLLRTENVSSLTDFGAGVGQYGHYLKQRLPNLLYYGYDGAGDVEHHTSGFVKYADLTTPLLDVPRTEWVLSLEVGEHIPSKFEGCFVRNLHRHNCKGVVLSWGVLGQTGDRHVNLHSNEYVVEIFEGLGYSRDAALEEELRREEDNFDWFRQSAFVFRRITPTCGF